MSLAVLFVLQDDPGGTLQCAIGGKFTANSVSSSSNIMNGKSVVLQGATFGSPVAPCTKAPPAFPAPCVSFAPALTMVTRTKVEGKFPVNVMMPQICMQNGIPAVIPIAKTSTVKVL